MITGHLGQAPRGKAPVLCEGYCIKGTGSYHVVYAHAISYEGAFVDVLTYARGRRERTAVDFCRSSLEGEHTRLPYLFFGKFQNSINKFLQKLIGACLCNQFSIRATTRCRLTRNIVEKADAATNFIIRTPGFFKSFSFSLNF